jgi:hypothetical protein
MAFKPSEITKEHIFRGIEEIKKSNKTLTNGTKWEVIINGKSYPPKEVMRFAREQYDGSNDWPKGGGWPTNEFLEKLGFKVIEKTNDPLLNLVQNYKEYIRKGGLNDELYKWRLLALYYGRPNPKSVDFNEEIKTINFANLIYPVGQAVIKHIANERAEPYRECFKILFDEKEELQKRITYFNEKTLLIYRELVTEERFSHHHDERTISTFLTYHNPNKYTFYKDSFYKKLVSLLGLKANKPGLKYVHYIKLIENFIDDYIKADQELIDLVNSKIPETSFGDGNHLILAQDILYQSLDKNLGSNKTFWRIGTKDDNQSYWDIMKREDKISIGWSDIGDLNEKEILSKNEIIELFNDEGIYQDKKNVLSRKAGEIFDFYKNIKIGDIVLAQDGENILGIGEVKDEYYFNPKDNFSHQKNVEWKVFNPKQRNSQGNLTTVYKINDANLINTINLILANPESLNNIIGKMKEPLNQILYGPPGTGKTYSTIEKSLNMIGIKTVGLPRQKVKELFNDKLHEGRINFTTFHQSMSYEDFIEGIKPITDEQNVVYEIQDGIFKNICNAATSNLRAENFDKVYSMLLQKIQNEDDEKLELKTSTNKSFWVGINSNGNLNLHTTSNKNHQGVLTKEKIKSFANGVNLFIGWEGYAGGIVSYMKQSLNLIIEADTEINNNYVLIIDEINRGNVSQIFGELITLIEKDKRLGNDEAIKITLPYSKKEFGVPSNVYIIGTMNTADRSVEALDTALRRRFSFTELLPNPDLLQDKMINGLNLKSLLVALNTRIEVLLDKDHTIGHSFFINIDNDDVEELKAVFKNCIIPLLQEYFYGDYEKIGFVLGKAFFEEPLKDIKNIFPKFYSGNVPEITISYKLKTINDSFDIINAVKLLLNDSES